VKRARGHAGCQGASLRNSPRRARPGEPSSARGSSAWRTASRSGGQRSPVHSPVPLTWSRGLIASQEGNRDAPRSSRPCQPPAVIAGLSYPAAGIGTASTPANDGGSTKPAARRNAADVLASLRAEQRDPGHGGRAARLRGEKNAAHQRAVWAWTGEQPDPAAFTLEILPGLRQTTIAQLAAATGLSAHYCSLIRLGKRVPHPRHWEALRSVAAGNG
jgi:hypothetical protein